MPVISVEHLSKTYRLGQIGTGTLSRDLEVWWAKVCGKPNPLLRIGETDHGNRDGEELWALRDVSFTVEQGEVLGIIGRNGAGKSTLLKILSRVTAPTSGKIKVKGRIASLLEVGTGFHPELTGRENIYLNGAILGMKRDEITRKFDEIVNFSEVEKFIDTPVKRYSSGMYVRLAFAVAAHLDPEILIVDEVLAVGDAEFQKKCLGKMGDVAGEGRTVLFVSHNMGSIEKLCRRSILLGNGKIVEDDLSPKVISSYLSVSSTTSSSVKFPNIDSDAFFNEIQIMNKDGDLSTIFQLHKPIHLLFSLVARKSIKDLEVSFAINSRGERIFYHTNRFAGEQYLVTELGYHHLIAKIPANLLTPGYYSLTASLHIPNRKLYDRKEHCITFEVINTDIYRYPTQFMGKVLAEIQWEILN